MIKLTILLRRHGSLSREQFIAHHETKHAALFTSLPVVKQHVRRYVQQHTLPDAPPGLPPPKYDGITELWFDDVAAVGAVFGDSAYLARVRPDEESFLDLHACDFLLSTEHVVMER